MKVRISVSVDPECVERLKAVAKAQHTTVSQVVNGLVWELPETPPAKDKAVISDASR
jgi:muconolactone delta-isomerase